LIKSTIEDANQFYANANSDGGILLPQIRKPFFDRLHLDKQGMKDLGSAWWNNFYSRIDDVDFDTSHWQNEDGSRNPRIPMRYTTRLENMKELSTDLTFTTAMYYQNAMNYSEMNGVLDELEAARRVVGRRQTKGKEGLESNTYKKLTNMMEMFVFGRAKAEVATTTKKGKINWNKLVNAFSKFARANNLMFNWFAQIANLESGKLNTLNQAGSRQYFNFKDWGAAEKIFATQSAMGQTGKLVQDAKLRVILRAMGIVTNMSEMTMYSGRSAATRTFLTSSETLATPFGWAGYEAGDYYMKGVAAISVMLNHRLSKDWGFVSEREFIDRYMAEQGPLPKSFTHLGATFEFNGSEYTRNGRAITLTKFRSAFYGSLEKTAKAEYAALPDTLYDSIIVEGDKLTLKPGIATKVDLAEFDHLLTKLTGSIKQVTSLIDSQISDTDRGKIAQTMFGQLLTMHRNFMIVAIEDRLKAKGYNWVTGQEEEGIFRTLFYRGAHAEENAFIREYFKALIEERFNFIAAAKSTWSQMSLQERTNVRRAGTELAVILALLILCFMVGIWFPDDDDKPTKQSFLANFSEYAFLLRPMVEQLSWWSPRELFNMLNSPLASGALINRMWYLGDAFNFGTDVKSGVYKDWSKAGQWWLRLTPYRHFWEVTGPQYKTNYLKHQII
jgi:hypothetical protein